MVLPPEPTPIDTGAFTYTSSNTAVATISGSTVTIIGAGTTTITAFQGFTEIYGPGSITTTFTVNQALPTMTNFSLPTKTFGDVSFGIVAPTTNSSGAFTYTSSDTTVATVSGSRITIVGATKLKDASPTAFCEIVKLDSVSGNGNGPATPFP